jgi:hypothetical protein
MFKQLRKALGLSPEPAAQLGVVTPGQLAQWAGAQRWAFAFDGEPDRFVLQGQVVEHPWRLESGAPSRDYMQGTELRVRAELALNPDAHVMVISRALKEELEGRVYGAITNSLQTTVDQSLPQEMRWLSIYEEMRWPQLPASFVRAFAVVGEDLDTARHWVNAALVSQLMRDQHVLAQFHLGDRVAVHLVRAVGKAQRAHLGCRSRPAGSRRTCRRRRGPAWPSRSPGRPCWAPPP